MFNNFDLIPVIDLLGGQVVHAQRGEREKYKPLNSILTDSASPVSIARLLLKKTKSNTLYVADLDAIQTRLPQKNAILNIASVLIGTEFWLDGGFATFENFTHLINSGKKLPNVCPAFSSESLLSLESAIESLEIFPESILSLDKKNNTFLNDSQICDYPKFWPKRIILMNLDKVGSENGPDIEWILKMKSES